MKPSIFLNGCTLIRPNLIYLRKLVTGISAMDKCMQEVHISGTMLLYDCRLTYVTVHSPTLLSLLLHHKLFTYVTWRATHVGQNKIIHIRHSRLFLPRSGSPSLSEWAFHLGIWRIKLIHRSWKSVYGASKEIFTSKMAPFRPLQSSAIYRVQNKRLNEVRMRVEP